jgi:hypothetical protein
MKTYNLAAVGIAVLALGGVASAEPTGADHMQAMHQFRVQQEADQAKQADEASYSDTRISHADGTFTDVHTDNQGTRAERSGGLGGSHDNGGSTAEDHHEMVREHYNPAQGDHIVDHSDHSKEHAPPANKNDPNL